MREVMPRAVGSASGLASAGRSHVTVLKGGPADWAERSGRSPGVEL